MKNNIINWSLILLISIGCKNKDLTKLQKEISQKTSNNSEQILLRNSQDTLYKSIQEVNLPFGDKNILINFPKKWNYPSIYEVEDRKKGKYEINLESVSKRFDSIMYNTSPEINKDSTNCFIEKTDKYFNYYDDYVNYIIKQKGSNSINIPVFKITDIGKGVSALIVSQFNPLTPDYQNLLTYHSTNGEIIDGLNIGYSKNVFEFSHSGKYYFIDQEKIIHLKSFLVLEDETILKYYEKFKILDSGNIVPYFVQKEGKVNNASETGKIKDNTKDGIWTETKPNMYVEQQTYVEALYKKGIPIGKWNYYDLTDDNKKGGKLLMKEEFSEDGQLLKREILNSN